MYPYVLTDRTQWYSAWRRVLVQNWTKRTSRQMTRWTAESALTATEGNLVASLASAVAHSRRDEGRRGEKATGDAWRG